MFVKILIVLFYTQFVVSYSEFFGYTVLKICKFFIKCLINLLHFFFVFDIFWLDPDPDGLIETRSDQKGSDPDSQHWL